MILDFQSAIPQLVPFLVTIVQSALEPTPVPFSTHLSLALLDAAGNKDRIIMNTIP